MFLTTRILFKCFSLLKVHFCKWSDDRGSAVKCNSSTRIDFKYFFAVGVQLGENRIIFRLYYKCIIFKVKSCSYIIVSAKQRVQSIMYNRRLYQKWVRFLFNCFSLNDRNICSDWYDRNPLRNWVVLRNVVFKCLCLL
jgi:hypothetical protein